MTSQTELLTLNFLKKFLESVLDVKKNFNIILELVTREFRENKISELLTRKIKKN